jgi:hypothetical protein
MNKIGQRILLGFVFVVMFFFFLYLSFPYGVLKETITAKISSETGITMRIDELSPAFPFGIKANGVEMIGGEKTKLKFKQVKATLSILKLFTLKFGVDIDVLAEPKGSLELGASIPILGLFGKHAGMPSDVSFTAKTFPMQGLVTYILRYLSDSGAASPLVAPLLGAMEFRGDLSGNSDFDIDQASISQSVGQVDLKFDQAILVLSHPSIGLPDQVFQTAQLKAKMTNALFTIDPATKFKAEEMELALSGKVSVKNVIPQSDMDVQVSANLSGSLGEKFGWIMDSLSGGASKGGVMNLQLRGTLGLPVPAPL